MTKHIENLFWKDKKIFFEIMYLFQDKQTLEKINIIITEMPN